MKNKEYKISCDGKDVAKILCSKDGCNFKLSDEGKKLLHECCDKDCC